jgi:hypothetical protein
MRIVVEAMRRRREIESSIRRRDRRRIIGELALHRQDGIFGTDRMHYRISPPPDPHAERVLKEVMAWLKDDKEMQRDRVRLVKVCCMASPPVQILGAPKPAGIAAVG